MKPIKHLFIIIVVGALFAQSASATLIGDTVSSTITPTPFWTVANVDDANQGGASASNVVGAGAEFYYFLQSIRRFEADFDAASITLTNTGPTRLGLGANELISWTDLDWTNTQGLIVGFNLSTSGTTGIDVSDITFGSDWLSFDIDNGAEWDTGSWAKIDLITRHVPESGSTLLMLGMVAGGVALRRRK